MKNTIFSEPTAVGKGTAGAFYGMQRVGSLTGWTSKVKDRWWVSESETKHGSVSGQETEKEEKKMARYLASIEFGNTQVFHEEGDDLKSLLFELGKRAVDYVFDKSEHSKEVAMFSIYDYEKRDNVYFSVFHNVKGSIQEVAEKPLMSRWKLRRNRLTAVGLKPTIL